MQGDPEKDDKKNKHAIKMEGEILSERWRRKKGHADVPFIHLQQNTSASASLIPLLFPVVLI